MAGCRKMAVYVNGIYAMQCVGLELSNVTSSAVLILILILKKMCLVPSIYGPDQPGNAVSKTVETVKIVTAW